MILLLHAHRLRKIYPGALHLYYFFPTLRYKDAGALHLSGYNAKGQRPAILVENSKAYNPEVQRTGIFLIIKQFICFRGGNG
jgi:hypothetical protein